MSTPATTAPAAPEAKASSEPKVVLPTPTFSGRVGTPFNIRGEGFGEMPGAVLAGNRPLEVTSWHDTIIKGVVPSDLKGGEYTITISGGRSFKVAL